MTRTRNAFGATRKLPSGRWQARYQAPDETQRTAPLTFDTKKAALMWLAEVQTDMRRGLWDDPKAGKVLFEDYARKVIAARKTYLAPRSWELYDNHLRKYLIPAFGKKELGTISLQQVDGWHHRMLRDNSPSTTRHAYVCFRVVMKQALRHKLVRENPVDVPGAFKSTSPERPHLSVSDFGKLVEAHPSYLHPLLHTTFGASLRIGEVVGLQHGDIDLKAGTLTVERQVTPAKGGDIVARPKTKEARTVRLIGPSLDILRTYIEANDFEPTDWLFTGLKGGRIQRSRIQAEWIKARKVAGLERFHVHDLRHSSLTLAAQASGEVREVQSRGEHSTTAPALRYQHAVEAQMTLLADKASALYSTEMTG